MFSRVVMVYQVLDNPNATSVYSHVWATVWSVFDNQIVFADRIHDALVTIHFSK